MTSLKEMDIRMLLTKYKNLARSAPSVFSDDEELDAYYDKVFEIEREIESRVKN
jgi:hypothetical protein